MKKQYQRNVKLIVNLLVFLFILLLCIFLLPKALMWFMPFIVGWVISCIANPLVVWLERKLKIKRKAGTVMVIIAVIAAVCGAGYCAITILVRQIAGFIAEIPEIWAGFSQDFSNFGNMIDHVFVKLSPKWTETLNSIGNMVGEYLTNITGSVEAFHLGEVGSMVGSIANIIISVIMCMLSSYFFIADREYFTTKVAKLIPESIREKYDIFYHSLKQAVGGYFKAQFRIEVWIYLLILIGLTILQIHYAILIGLVIAALDFLPFFGTGAVFWPWAILMLLSGDYVRAIGFIIIWGVGQLVRQFIQPKIMGDSIGMEPIPTLFLLYIGYKLAGVGGMILAVPVGIIVVNMNEAGIFDSAKYSLRILIANLNKYRKLDEEDMKILEEENEQSKDEKGRHNR